MIRPDTLAVICGVLSGLAWGAGDFSGGLATRRGSVLPVILFSQSIGCILLFLLAAAFGGALPPLPDLAAGAAAGIFGVLGLTALYKGLADGRMGLVAPMSAVVAAVVPLAFSWVTEGTPGPLRTAGFALAMVAVWFLSRPGGSAGIQRGEVRLSVLAGLGFGLFFVLVDHASRQTVLWPLLAARVAAVLAMLVTQTTTGQLATPRHGQWVFITLAGMLDAAGNASFGMAAHLGRLDMAAILASLYPATTVVLAWLVFHERLNRQQWGGVAAAGVALVLIAW